jgi:rod shape-determining protein MreC
VSFGTLDSSPPPFFKQGYSALTKLVFYGALSLFLMMGDSRFHLSQPLRAGLSLVIYPVQWVAMRPTVWWNEFSEMTQDRDDAQNKERETHQKLLAQSLRALQVDQLTLENQQLRNILALRDRVQTHGLTAEVLYDAADPYTRKLIIDKGALQGVTLSSPVMDEYAILGQVTSVHPLVSEVTLVIDRENSIPVLNTRTGARGVAFGEAGGAPLLELRYMATNADIEVGDELSTSGVDGVYPPGIPIAKVTQVERKADSVFARILCEPQGKVQGARMVMVLDPVTSQLPAKPTSEKTPASSTQGGKK